MNSSNPKTPRAELPKPSSNMLDGMTQRQVADWVGQQLVDALNEMAREARAKKAQEEGPDQTS